MNKAKIYTLKAQSAVNKLKARVRRNMAGAAMSTQAKLGLGVRPKNKIYKLTPGQKKSMMYRRVSDM